MSVRTALLAVLLTAAGCIHMLPPVATPRPMEPPRGDAPPPGHGLVYVDVVNGPTLVRVVKQVEVKEEVSVEGEPDQEVDTEELETVSACTSPCVLNLPLGGHLLDFPMRGTGGDDLVHVIASPSPTVYRRALGWRKKGGAGFVLGVLATVLGGASFTTGAVLLPVGLANDSHGMTLAGEITLGTGALLLAAGIWAIANNPLMEQPGAGAQYGLRPTD